MKAVEQALKLAHRVLDDVVGPLTRIADALEEDA